MQVQILHTNSHAVFATVWLTLQISVPSVQFQSNIDQNCPSPKPIFKIFQLSFQIKLQDPYSILKLQILQTVKFYLTTN